jgi:asparagine synthase (glutamine-hydrolysing)
MCGFVAAIALAPGALIDRRAVERATELLYHRGPDATSVMHDNQFSFGHRRLRIIDLDKRSDQPFSDHEVTLVYNGEIYNFRELRHELTDKGAQFRTTGDTEVVLQAYLAWGDDCVHHLEGIFAFVLFDRRQQRALVVRDHLGVKPVYYARHGDVLLVGSEPKVIMEFDEFNVSLDPATLSAFLTFRHAIESEQWVRGIHQLLPGCRLSVEADRLNLSAYWRADAIQRPYSEPEEFAVALRNAVRSQLVSDVPIGLLLSGGLDSSVIAVEATRAARMDNNFPLHSYTALFQEEKYNETHYAAEVAAHLDIPLRAVEIEPYVSRKTIEMLVCRRDAPLGMHNEIPMYALAAEVRRDAKVLICGEGADEALAGYTRLFRLPFDIERINRLAWLPVIARQHLARIMNIPETCPSDAMSLFFERYSYFSQAEKQALFRPEIWDMINHDSRLWTAVNARLSGCAGRPLFDRISHFFVGLHLPGLLGMIDGTTMAASVEARVPFCDRHLIEIAFALRQQDKLDWRSPLHRLSAILQPISRFSERADCGKVVVRRTYSGSLPKRTTTRRKMGFVTPLKAWIWGPLGELRQEMLESPSSPLFTYFREEPVRLWLEQSCRGDDKSSRKLWMLITLGVYLNRLSNREPKKNNVGEFNDSLH